LCCALIAPLEAVSQTRTDSQGELAARVGEVILGPQYRQGRWGLVVQDLVTSQTLIQHNADQSFIPASSIKLYFCAAALAELGPKHRFETPVFRRGEVRDGILEGDLILRAQGDPTLGGRDTPGEIMAFTDDDHTYANATGASSTLTDTDPLSGLNILARQVAAAGIREVHGDVLVDDRLFDLTRNNGNGPDWLSPIVVNDNLVDLLVTSGHEVGASATVQMRPVTTLFEVKNEVVTVAEREPSRVQAASTGPFSIRLRGQLALKSRGLLRNVPVQDPAMFARFLFVEALGRAGVRLVRTASIALLPSRTEYARLPRVAVLTSLPLDELLTVTLKTSSNVYANTLPLVVAAKYGETTYAEGLKRLERRLRALGVDLTGVSLATASGGTVKDRLTPRSAVQVLRTLHGRKEFAGFFEALPVLGVDGTLADVVAADSPAKGKVRAKTGTFFQPATRERSAILRCKALAGVMTTARGRELAFAFFVNDVPLPPGVDSTREARALGRLCEIIYMQVP
jgi:D-alanyl-D-alanine carboxypeptidase/D-alanyl-D-alanine-endopeptidase (penicillin-binding protein 4)